MYLVWFQNSDVCARHAAAAGYNAAPRAEALHAEDALGARRHPDRHRRHVVSTPPRLRILHIRTFHTASSGPKISR